LHTNLLFPIDFNSGSPPKFPTIITLLIPAIFFSYFLLNKRLV
jgi:hypothetical protein